MNDIDPRDSGRNLFFGILAFQNDFIDRAALLRAFDAWTVDKTRPLGRILADQGAIGEEWLALINGLVAARFARHGNQADKSLASMGPIGSIRDDLEALADGETKIILTHIAVGSPDGESTVSLPHSAGTSTSSGLRFQILRPLSAGGMGVVSVALDKELDRSIALKEIREAAADDSYYRARFMAEAEITGKLEHPGIIPIYGLGTYPDGRPFYAMRLIRGDKTGSFKEAIERFHNQSGSLKSTVEFRGLLRRFLDVCNAISYAHSKGVLHRDLKPDNILVGPYGETLVVDWGLAKAAGRDDPGFSGDGHPVRLNLSGSELSPTMVGSPFGTPGYAPPEQMVGDLENVGPRSDVYGLGAILYSVMTGQAPYSSQGLDLGELVKKIETGNFPPPRQLQAGLDKPLEAICLKAMSVKPADRYESVRTLAADLEKYLADEPVSAYSEPWIIRARRWTRRHRTAVTATVAALAVATVGLGAVSAVQTKARNDLAGKNGDLRNANASLEVQRRRAEDRESQAIEAVKRFRDAVADEPELKNSPSLGTLRNRLLKTPLTYFRSLRARLEADHDTRPESLARLAQASFDLGILSADIGDTQDALKAHMESLSIRRKLADANPGVEQYQIDLASSQNNVGNLLIYDGKSAEAMKAYESSVAIRRKLADANPTIAKFQRDLASGLNNIGGLLLDTGRSDEALKAYEASLEIRRKLAETHPNISEDQYAMARSHFNIGLLLSAIGKTAEALKSHDSALILQGKLAEADPTNTQLQSFLSRIDDNIGILLNQSGKRLEALKAHEEALAIRRKLAKAYPTNTDYQIRLADSYSNLGIVLYDLGKPDQSREAMEAALAIQRRLAEANPFVTKFQSDLANSLNNIGQVLNETGESVEAMKSCESALTIQRKLVLDHPELPNFARDLAQTLNTIATFDRGAKRLKEARLRLQEAVEWQRKALERSPANPVYERSLAAYLDTLKQVAQELKDSEPATEDGKPLKPTNGPPAK